jgi:hypothetical protein
VTRVHPSTIEGSALPDYIEDRNGNKIIVDDQSLHGGAAGAFSMTDTAGRPSISSSGFGPSGTTNTVTVGGLPYKVAWTTIT